MTKNRTPTPVYLDPGMHPGLEVKGVINLILEYHESKLTAVTYLAGRPASFYSWPFLDGRLKTDIELVLH